MNVEPTPYGAGECDDCKRDQLLVEYGQVRICRTCTRTRLYAQQGDERQLRTLAARPHILRAEPGPGRCADCNTLTSQGVNYPLNAYLCDPCERAMLRRVGLQPTPIEHDEIAA